jgi:hypothetical protein
MISRCNILFTAALFGTLILAGCQTSNVSASKGSPESGRSEAVVQGDSAVIKIVRNGVLADHNSTTVGKAFEGTFQNAKWSSFETPKGEVVVQFDGTVMPDVLEGANLYARQSAVAVRNRCIESLGLKSKIEQQAQAAQKEEQQRFATGQSIEERRQVVQLKVSQRFYLSKTVEERAQDEQLQRLQTEVEDLNRQRIALAAAHDESAKAQKEFAEDIEAKIQPCIKTTPFPVSFQFLLSADKKTFEINYVDKQVFEANEVKALEFIYR